MTLVRVKAESMAVVGSRLRVRRGLKVGSEKPTNYPNLAYYRAPTRLAAAS
jgi:hypothetical protein